MKNKILNNVMVSFAVLITVTLFTGLIFQACTEDEEVGIPVVSYIRVTNPDLSDSLVTHAFMGSTIAIIGENLEDVVEIWFNDQEAILNKSFITGSSIIVTVPNDIPGTVTNEMRLITRDKTEVNFPFGVDVPGPLLQSMLCEYVKEGETAVIKGNFFIDDENVPIQVLFPGNIEGEIVSVDIKEIQVKVPAGAGVGPLVVKSIYGSTRSSFYFRDDRGVFLDFDTKLGAGWRPGKTQGTNPEGISGNYVALRGSLASDWDWVEDDLACELWGNSAGLPNGPLFEGDPADLALKFEAYIVNEWTGGYMQLIFSPWSNASNAVNSDNTIARGLWRPWEASGKFITEDWITVTVPLTDFKYDSHATVNNLALVYPDNCGSITFFVWGPVPAPCNLFICLDNVRVVPK